MFKQFLILSCLLQVIAFGDITNSTFAQETEPQPSCDSKLALDWNCDGKQWITILGDSFVAGIGDTNLSNLNGYIGRSQKALPKIKIDGFGTAGQDTTQLLAKVRTALQSDESTGLLDSLMNSDIIILDIGRNDRWFFGAPSTALKNLGTIRKLIQSSLKEKTGIAPVVVLAVLRISGTLG